MSNRGFPKIANIGYTHMKPNLCPLCIHCIQGGGLVRARGYTHVCHAKHAILSAITTEKGRCEEFQPIEEEDSRRISQKDVDEELTLLREIKAKQRLSHNASPCPQDAICGACVGQRDEYTR